VIRFRRGTALLNSVIKTFEKSVADLEVASQQIDAQRQKTVEKRQAAWDKYIALETQTYEAESVLAEAQYRARQVANNIAKLIAS
jgi:hypothetical protein